MNTMLHAFANGSAKQMLFGGALVDAASGRRFESRNLATGASVLHGGCL